MEKFLIEVENIPTEEASKALYDELCRYGKVNMIYTGSKAYIYGDLKSEAVDDIEDEIGDKGYAFTTERG